MFDPELGRFLSADPFVQFKHNQQSFNRYSYVLNNPLSFTDPSGYFIGGIGSAIGSVGSAIGGAIDGVVNAHLDFFDDVAQGIRDFGDDVADFMDEHGRTIAAIAITAAMPGNPIAAGFLSSLISSGGDLRAAMIGGITAGAFSGLHIWQPTSLISWSGVGKVAAHGMVGGASSMMNGGSFKAGFMAAAVTQSVSQGVGNDVFGKNVADPMVRTKNAFAAAAIGGTTSVLTGGKFKNGAMTGAFSRMFNDLHADIFVEEQKRLINEAERQLEYYSSASTAELAEEWGMSALAVNAIESRQSLVIMQLESIRNAGLANLLIGNTVATTDKLIAEGLKYGVGKFAPIQRPSWSVVDMFYSPNVNDFALNPSIDCGRTSGCYVQYKLSN